MKALNKIGITGFTEEDVAKLFDAYDANRNNAIDYKEFVGSLFGNVSIKGKEKNEETKPQVTESVKKSREGRSNKEYIDRENLNQILQRIRDKLASRGVRGIISLGKAFKIMDDDNSHSLDINEFVKASRDYRLDMTEEEARKAFKAFDRTGDGTIDYDEFLRVVRGNMNNFRRKFVDQAFNIMDKDKNGHLDINDIRGVYNAKFHPDVKAGKKTEDNVLLEFLETFEQHHNLFTGESADHIITREEWIEYYENVSMSIDDDKYFELMMNNCWKINGASTTKNDKKGWSDKQDNTNSKSQNLQQNYQSKRQQTLETENNAQRTTQSNYNPTNGTNCNDTYEKRNKSHFEFTDTQSNAKKTGVELILEKFRSKVVSRGGRGMIGLARQFKIFDDDNSKSLEYEEFAKAIKDFRVDMSTSEIKMLFNYFDVDGNGSVNYDEFLRTIRGEMNDTRKKVVKLAFNKLDLDRSGVIELNEIKQIYSVKKHPEVISGKKTEDEVYGEFIETFETHFNVRSKTNKDRSVTLEEFMEYYNNISCSIDSDEYFDLMMTNAWNLKGQKNNNAMEKGTVSNDSPSVKNLDIHEGKRIWLKSQYKAQFSGGSVADNAPFGTTKDPINYSTNLRPQTSQAKKSKDASVNKLREKLAARGTRGILGIRRAFKIADDDNSHTIDLREFIKMMKDFRIGIEEEDAKKVFNIFDRDGSGFIDYDEFMRGIVGEMTDSRRNIVKKAFEKIDKNGNGVIELNDLSGVYNAKKHPDVISGKKSEEEVLGEYLDNFEMHYSLLVNIIY